jgi:hypothetical protein
MAWLGLICGVLYSFGGLVIDLGTTGLNGGTALTFLALIGMPLLLGGVGFLAGVLIVVVAPGVRGLLDRMPT